MNKCAFVLGLFIIGVTGCATGPDGHIMDAYPVGTVDWSPDGRHIAAGTTANSIIYLIDAKTQRIKAVLTTPGATMDIQPTKAPPVAFSPDSRLLATGGLEDGWAVRIWDVETGKALRSIAGGRFIKTLAFSPDGHLLAAAGPAEEITVWDPATGSQLAQWKAHEGGTLALAFAPDGSTVLSGGKDHRLKFWDVRSFAAVRSIDDFTGDVTGIGFSPNGDKRMAVASGASEVRLYELDQTSPVNTPQVLPRNQGPVPGEPSLLDVVMLLGAARSMRIVGAPTGYPLVGTPVRTAPELMCAPNVQFSPDGRRVATVIDQERLHIHITDLASNQTVQTGRVIGCSVAFSPDGKSVIGGGFSASVRIFDPSTGNESVPEAADH